MTPILGEYTDEGEQVVKLWRLVVLYSFLYFDLALIFLRFRFNLEGERIQGIISVMK